MADETMSDAEGIAILTECMRSARERGDHDGAALAELLRAMATSRGFRDAMRDEVQRRAGVSR